MAASFLTPILRDAPDRFSLWNTRTDRVIARRIEPAFDSRTRNQGLLGRDELAQGTAMILAPCSAIHSCFMRFPIDVAFVDRSGVVIKIAAGLRPWRIAFALRAFAVVEMSSGALATTGTIAGDRLQLKAQ